MSKGRCPTDVISSLNVSPNASDTASSKSSLKEPSCLQVLTPVSHISRKLNQATLAGATSPHNCHGSDDENFFINSPCRGMSGKPDTRMRRSSTLVERSVEKDENKNPVRPRGKRRRGLFKTGEIPAKCAKQIHRPSSAPTEEQIEMVLNDNVDYIQIDDENVHLLLKDRLIEEEFSPKRPDVDCNYGTPVRKELDFSSPNPPKRGLKKLFDSGDDCSPMKMSPVAFRRSKPKPSPVKFQKSPADVRYLSNRAHTIDEQNFVRVKHVLLPNISGDMIGDFSRQFQLPTVPGKNGHLTYITPETLNTCLEQENSKFNIKIIDCRYPYEYEGGHIKSAINIWNHPQMIDYFFGSRPLWVEKDTMYKTNILVFYCEFSSERAPTMASDLRKYDRGQNQYPHLHYPEVYILRGGYQAFYEPLTFLNNCEPASYTTMRDDRFSSDLCRCKKERTRLSDKSKRPIEKHRHHLH